MDWENPQESKEANELIQKWEPIEGKFMIYYFIFLIFWIIQTKIKKFLMH